MLYIVIILFALAAVVGFIILKNWLTSATTARTTVYLHGTFAALALIILVIYAFQNTSHYPKASIILFIVAALVGFYMFSEDLRKKYSPMWLAFTHALFAIAGFLLLLFFVFG